MNYLLDDVRILDFTTEMGSYCTKLFADLGAEVLKIESHEGDSVRKQQPFYKHKKNEEMSLKHFFMNTNKKSMTLDITTTDGQEVVKKLINKFDVVVENFPPGYLDSIGLGYSELKEINPNIVVTSITGFGQEGPYSDFKTTDLIGVAMGGLMNLGGYPDTPPVRPYGEQGFYAVSLYAAVGTIIAIYNRDVNGIGQHVDVSMQDAVATALENSIQFYDLEGTVRNRVGAAGNQAGWGIYPCADGEIYLIVAGLGDRQTWENFINWLKENNANNWETLKEDQWFDLEYRSSPEGKEAFKKIFTSFSLKRDKLELYDEGQKRGIIICPVNDPSDLLKNPQLNAREFFVDLYHESLGEKITYPGGPYRLSETPWALKSPAPKKGEHTEEMLMEMGFTDGQMKTLKEKGVT